MPQDITNVFRIKDFLHLQFQLLSNGIKNIPPGNGHSLTCPKNNDSSRGYNMNAVIFKAKDIEYVLCLTSNIDLTAHVFK